MWLACVWGAALRYHSAPCPSILLPRPLPTAEATPGTGLGSLAEAEGTSPLGTARRGARGSSLLGAGAPCAPAAVVSSPPRATRGTMPVAA